MSPFRLTPSCMKLAWETHSGSEERDIYFEPKNKSRGNNFLPLYQTRNSNKSRFCFIVPSSMLYFSSIQIKVVSNVLFTNALPLFLATKNRKSNYMRAYFLVETKSLWVKKVLTHESI